MKKRIIQPTEFYDHSEIIIKPCPVSIAKPCSRYSPTFYPLQSQAFEEYDRRENENIKVFSRENSENGKREFFVANEEEFWKFYDNEDPIERHYYEIIKENTPCRLYFDLEYEKEFNESVDENKLLNDFYYSVSSALFSLFDIYINPNNFVPLCSSRKEKFSYHFVIHMNEKILFKSNVEIKSFIEELYNNYSLPSLWVNGKDGDNSVYVIDKNVYTKNRAFRLYLSSKYNKKQILTTPPNMVNPLILSSEERLSFFKKTLITDFWDKEELKSFKLLDYKHHLEYKNPIIDNRINSVNISNDSNSNTIINNNNLIFQPLIDYILNTFRNGEAKQCDSYIRNWVCTYTEKTCFIVLNIEKYRWCGNINRWHKSNHIYFVVDVSYGCYYQKCYDVDCSNYKSEAIPLTQDILKLTINSLRKYFCENKIEIPLNIQNIT